MPSRTLAPQQERSRESLRRLLRAAAEVLGQHGVEGATIPRIASHAGLTPGAVYRRFKDKDALIEAVILRILERQAERLSVAYGTDREHSAQLAPLAEQFIGNLVVSYRAATPLLRAIRVFSQRRVHSAFWRKAVRYEAATMAQVVSLFMACRDEISHPDPRLAISTGLMMVMATLTELLVMTVDLGPLKTFLPKDDLGLKRELTRAFLAYLGASSRGSARRRDP